MYFKNCLCRLSTLNISLLWYPWFYWLLENTDYLSVDELEKLFLGNGFESLKTGPRQIDLNLRSETQQTGPRRLKQVRDIKSCKNRVRVIHLRVRGILCGSEAVYGKKMRVADRLNVEAFTQVQRCWYVVNPSVGEWIFLAIYLSHGNSLSVLRKRRVDY